MSWLDSVSLKFLDPYHARILTQYRELHKQAPPAVQSSLDTAESYYNWAMANQDPRVKVSGGREKCGGRRATSVERRTRAAAVADNH